MFNLSLSFNFKVGVKRQNTLGVLIRMIIWQRGILDCETFFICTRRHPCCMFIQSRVVLLKYLCGAYLIQVWLTSKLMWVCWPGLFKEYNFRFWIWRSSAGEWVWPVQTAVGAVASQTIRQSWKVLSLPFHYNLLAWEGHHQPQLQILNSSSVIQISTWCIKFWPAAGFKMQL